jgi:nitrogen PTS system EIIA component
MDFRDLIAPDNIVSSMRAKTKKQALQDLAEIAAQKTGLAARDIFETLLGRERLGSTGVGLGIAIPHARMASVTKMTCLFARMAERIPFDSPDGEPVDLIFLLLAPEHAGADHLKALARISRLLREPETAVRLRAAKTTDALFAILTDPLASNAA